MSDFDRYTTPKCRISKDCMECTAEIRPGAIYHRWQGMYDGVWFSWWTCAACHEWLAIAKALDVPWFDYGTDMRFSLAEIALEGPGDWWTLTMAKHLEQSQGAQP